MFRANKQLQLIQASYVHIAGFICALCYLILSLQNFTNYKQTLLSLLGVVFVCSLLSFIVFFNTQEKNMTLFPIIFWAVIFRIIGFFSEPVLEDDFYRYLWDGFVFAQYNTPYGIAPIDFFADTELDQKWHEILDGINYPDVTTIYGPVLEYVFLLSYYIKAGALWPLKLCLLAADGLCIFLIYKWVSARYVLLYAWCPLLIKEVAFTAHTDIIGIVFMLLALYTWQKYKPYRTGIYMALAIASKPFALLLAPVFIKDLRALASCFLALIVVYLPFIIQGETEFSTLALFYKQWEFNSSVYALVSMLTTSYAKLICTGILITICLIYWLKIYQYNNKAIPRGDYLLGGMLLLSAVANSWYLLWMLPFITIYPSIWGWTTVTVIVLSYVTGNNIDDPSLGTYEHPVWLRPIEFGIIACSILYSFYLRKYSPKK